GAGGAGTAPDTAGTADTRPASGTAGTRPASDTTPATPVFRHPLTDAPVAALAWDPATPTLRYLSAGTVHSLDLTAPLTSGWLARPAALQLLSPDGRLLATAERTADGYRFHLRDTRTGHIVAEPPPVSVARADRPLMTFSPEGEAFAYGATGFRDASPDPAPFAVWDVPGHRQRAALALDGPPASGVRSIALTPGGRDLLVSRATAAGPLTGEVWNTAHGTRTTEPKALAAALGGALSAGFTGRAAALPFGWDSEVPLADGDRPDVLALSPDRTHLATGGAFGTVTVWEGTRDRHRAAVLPAAPVAPDCASCARVTALAFSPDGRTLAVGHASGALRLWDTATWQPLGGSLNTPGDALRSLAFSADGTSVHASGAHVPVQTYALDPARVVAQLCARAGTTLTRAEWHTYLPEVPYLRLCEQPPASEDADSDTDSDSDPAPAPAPVTASPDARERSVRESAVREGAVPGPAVPETAAPETSPPDRHAPSTETPSATPRRPKGETDLRAPDKTRRPASGNRDRHSEARRLFTPLTCIAQQFRAPECGR
ncbi:WD40 repeat domain-containing protein, partial [Streptomyces sp. NPDC096132]|uniref:WD40 repeat domain-containing protein n=1 Tax=Streptomyces sp. NPDC096132 TaxID=3366075 RepID=UPI0037F95143